MSATTETIELTGSTKDGEDRFTARLVTVTPAMAKRWLDTVEGNRRVRKARVLKYARDMKNGEWMLTGEPIKFSNKGFCIDGQHRLHACIEADTSFPTLIVTGLPGESFEVMDAGAPRTAADILGIRGETNTITMASIARTVWMYLNTTWWNHGSEDTPTRTETLEVIDAWGDLIRRWATQKYAFSEHLTRPSKVAAVFAVYELEGWPYERLDTIADKLAEGWGLDKNHPIRHLRNRLIEDKNAKERLTRYHHRAIVVKAINKTLRGEELKLLKWSEREDYPQVVKPAKVDLEDVATASDVAEATVD